MLPWRKTLGLLGRGSRLEESNSSPPPYKSAWLSLPTGADSQWGGEHGCAKLADQLAVTRCLEVVKMSMRMCLNLNLSLLLVPCTCKAQDVRSLWSLTHCVFMSFSEFRGDKRQSGGLGLETRNRPGHQGLFRFSPVGKHVRFFISGLLWFGTCAFKTYAFSQGLHEKVKAKQRHSLCSHYLEGLADVVKASDPLRLCSGEEGDVCSVV